MSSKKTNIVFFDLPSNLPNRQSVSPWCWRVRLALNYKGLSYRTEWIDYPDISSTCESLHIPPTNKNPDGTPRWDLPALIDETDPESPVRIADAQNIVLYLEEKYHDPSRSLFPSPFTTDGPAPCLYLLLKQFSDSYFVPYLAPLIIEETLKIMTPRSIVFKNAQLRATTGAKSLAAISAGKEGSPEKEAVWAKLEEGFGVLAKLLESGEQLRWKLEGNDVEKGEFFMGNRLTYADIYMCGTLIMIRTASPTGWERVRKWHCGRWQRLWNAMEEYIKVV
ncbi:hypothetical protein C8Q75DRAFT_727178 [Abortiporus biennis]|nr:hypothetical protein C8Q75DRAFT_727178 [Abortiporus biennis]